MAKIQPLLLCFVVLIGSNLAIIPYDEVKFNIFDDRPRDFEFAVIESTRIVKSFFDRFDVSLAIAGGMAVFNSTPYIGNFSKIIPLVRDTLASKGEWRTIFANAILDETTHTITENELRWMKSTIKTIQTKMKLLSDDNPDLDNRKTMASIIHTDLNKMINFFDRKSSLYRKYPLLGTAPLIHLSNLVATFCPIAKMLIPLEAKNPQISCKMHDVLNEFLPRAIATRLQKLDAEDSIFRTIVDVMSMPYNPNGYNKTNPGVIDCAKGCKDRRLYTELCLTDAYSPDKYYVSDKYTSTCINDYVALVRHRIEELFPIEQLDQLCVNRTEQIPTGYGWFSILLLNAYTYGEENGKTCKWNPSLGCDPFVILYVNDKEVLRTLKETDQFVTNVNKTFTSIKIPKTSKIRIEIWDARSGYFEKDMLVLKSEGDVDSFLSEPIRRGVYVLGDLNRIETLSFWIDEYNFKNVPFKKNKTK